MGKKSRKRPHAAATPVCQAPPAKKPGIPPAAWATLMGGALAVRVVFLVSSRTSNPFFFPELLDPAYYDAWAKKILAGDWGPGVFYGLPLYPAFLAACYRFFEGSIVAVKVVQALLGVGAVFFTAKTAEKLHSGEAGLAAGVFAALYGPIIFHEQILIPEALAVPLYAAGLWLACRFDERPTVKRGIVLGVVCGLAALAKAGVLAFVAAFAAYRLWRKLRGLEDFRPTIAFLLAALACLAPVTAHNRIRGNDFVPLTSHSGFNFYIGNNEQAEGVFRAPEGTGTNVDTQIEDSKFIAERALGRPLKPSEVSKYWSDRAWTFIRSNPSRFLWLTGRKLLLFFDAREISDVEDYRFLARFIPFLRFPWPGFAILGPLFFGALAAWGALRHRATAGLWVGAYLLGVASFFINARYRLPVVPAMIAVAACGVFAAWNDWRQSRWARLALYAVAAGAGVAVSRLDLVHPDFSRDYVNVGDVALKHEDFPAARESYRQAIETNPDSPKANLAMGLVLSRMNRRDEAKPFYEKTIRLDSKNSMPYNNLGMYYDSAGDLDQAERLFLKAIELQPGSSQAHNNLGMVYGKRGQDEKAVEELELSIRLKPGARAYTNLGVIYYRQGRREEAARLWKKALEIDPNYTEALHGLRLVNG